MKKDNDIINLSNEREVDKEMTKEILQLIWDNETQKYMVGRIGTFIDHKGNEFIGIEEFFPTNRSIEEIMDFLAL